MRTLSAFAFVTLDGFYKDLNNDTSWHHHSDEGNEYSIQQLQSNHILLFGKTTYEMMNSFWPTPMAKELYPEVAEKMNAAEKIVLSNSLTKVTWNNTTILSGDTLQQIKDLKQTKGKNISILGSGKVVQNLTEANLIDEYQLMVDPIVLGQGVPLFDGITQPFDLKRTDIKPFKKSGTIVLTYKRVLPTP